MVKIKNRRKGPDFVIKVINFTAVVCWILIFIIFVLFGMSKPPAGSYMGKHLGKTWDTELLQYAFFLMFPLVITGVVGLLINSTRHQRKDDTYRMSLIISVIASIIGIIAYLVAFI